MVGAGDFHSTADDAVGAEQSDHLLEFPLDVLLELFVPHRKRAEQILEGDSRTDLTNRRKILQRSDG